MAKTTKITSNERATGGKKRGNKMEKKSIVSVECERGASVETKYRAMESYFNAWNNANSM